MQLFVVLVLLAPMFGAAMDSGDIGDSNCARETRLAALRPAPPTLTIWSYFGQQDFKSAALLDLRHRGEYGYYSFIRGWAGRHADGFHPTSSTFRRWTDHRPWFEINPVLAELRSGSSGNTLLERNQSFSLQVMEDTQYINSRLKDAQSEVPNQVHPDQIIFVELTTERSGRELVKLFGKVPSNARREPLEDGVERHFSHFEGFKPATPRQSTYQLKEGASWLISGQPAGRPMKLLLESEDLLTPIDRARYPYVWETGRAAQISKAAFRESLSAALYLAARELILLGGDLKDAYVFGHSLNPRIGGIYRRYFRMADFSGYQDSPGQMAHIAPLAQGLTFVDFQNLNPSVHAITQASNGALTAFEAMKIYFEAEQQRTEYLSDSEGRVVQLRDFSRLPMHQAELLTQKWPSLGAGEGRRLLYNIATRSPLCEPRDNQARSLEDRAMRSGFPSFGRTVKTQNPYNQLPEEHLQELDSYLREFNSIEIHCDDASISPEERLIIAYRRAEERLRDLGEPNPRERLIDLGITFTLYRSEHPRLPANPVQWYLRRERVFTMVPFAFSMTEHTLENAVNLWATNHSAADVAKLADTIPLTRTYARGETHLRRYLAHPDLFGF